MTLDRLQAKAKEWNVALDEIRETATSLLGFGVRDGRRVVLKLTKVDDEAHSGKVLQAFGSSGAVTVYEAETGAVLMERLEPGKQLVNLVRRGEDDEATKILAQVIQKLAHHEAPEECPSVIDWGRGFDRYVRSGDLHISYGLIREAQDVYKYLAASQGLQCCCTAICNTTTSSSIASAAGWRSIRKVLLVNWNTKSVRC